MSAGAAPAASATSAASAAPASQGARDAGAEQARLSQAPHLDWAAIGFRCGLEIHQQLDTRKLFSPCRSEVVEPDEIPGRAVAQVDRRLRATASELGEVDVAALAEAGRRRTFRYVAIDGLTSLVETDEEPPHPMSPEALDVTLTFAGLLGATPAAEVHVMRKTVIDGSNTSGFQRTALVATGGKVDVTPGQPADDVGVWTVAVEEDSARKLGERDGLVTYTLDRLGIPLIEVATAPDIRDPQHAQRAAARIGALLRATGRVKRGLGTIRQDLNVSVAVGARVEIKGCQDLRAVPRVIELECRRQLWMDAVRRRLAAAGARPPDAPPVDASPAFAGTAAKSIQEALGKGQAVLGLRLPGFAGHLKGAAKDGPRLGRELADHAKAAAGVRGIFHSDELPAYGITQAEAAAARALLGCGPADAFALCVEAPEVAARALAAVAARAAAALEPARSEVRAAQPDDATRFMRPMPGAARMYPETDVPPTRITTGHWHSILAGLPPKPERKVEMLVQAHQLNEETARQLVQEGADADLPRLVAAGAEPNLAARILLQLLPALKHPARVAAHVPALLGMLKEGRFAKEALPDILSRLDKDARLDPEAAAAKAGAGAADAATVDAVIARVLGERLDFVKARGMAAMGPLMGPVMAELRGKADGQLISARLKAALEAHSR